VIGAYMVVGRCFADGYLRQRNSSGLTDRRVIVGSGLFGREVRTLPLKSHSEVARSEKADGSGTITIGPTSPRYGWIAGTPWPGRGGSTS
jgi:hypothetical protein